MPLALGMFVLAIALVGVVSVAKARGALPQTKFSIGQNVRDNAGAQGSITSVIMGNPVRYDVQLAAGVLVTNVPEEKLFPV
jgi:hypothetical protein